MQEVAQRLKSLRESVGVSQAKLAALMGTTQASVNRYENGHNLIPTIFKMCLHHKKIT